MKLFLKIFAALLALFILVLVGLNLYLTDERLKNMILPHVQEAAGSEVQVDRMSLTFFRTFPRFGLDLDGVLVPDPQGDPVLSVEELLLSLELFPLLRDEISISRLSITRPSVFTQFMPTPPQISTSCLNQKKNRLKKALTQSPFLASHLRMHQPSTVMKQPIPPFRWKIWMPTSPSFFRPDRKSSRCTAWFTQCDDGRNAVHQQPVAQSESNLHTRS
jgi:hypothetical protein